MTTTCHRFDCIECGISNICFYPLRLQKNNNKFSTFDMSKLMSFRGHKHTFPGILDSNKSLLNF